MKEDKFDEHVEGARERIKETLQTKSKEYARDDNRYHNFDRAAQMDGITPERALIGMMRKHEVSIRDIVNDIDDGKNPDLNVVAEKISDNVNYLILLEGLIKRRVDEDPLKRVLQALSGAGLSIKDVGGFVHNIPITDKEEATPLSSLIEVTVSFDGGKTYMDLEEALKRGRDEE